MKIGLYAGSFDPISRGHLDIVNKGLQTFDRVHIAAAVNPTKLNGLFTANERLDLIRQSIREEWDADVPIDVGSFHGKSVTKYAIEVGATHLIRGLRQASDFDDEFRYHGVCERMDPTLTMVHFICEEKFLHVSSSTARELAALGEDTSWLVKPCVEAALKAKFS